MRLRNRGFSSVVDAAVLGLALGLSLAFLQVFSMTQANTAIKNVEAETSNEYVSNALNALDYVTVKDAGYETVQDGSIGLTYDSDLQKIIDASAKIRNYTGELDNTLSAWENNVTLLGNYSEELCSQYTQEIRDMQGKLGDALDSINDASEDLKKAPSKCYEMADEVGSYGDLLDTSLTGGCSAVGNFTGDVENQAGNVTAVISRLNNTLENLTSLIEDLNASIQEKEKIISLIRDGRCVLSELNVKLDNYVSYIQYGVNENNTLVDLFPAKAGLETLTVSRAVGESLYVEDRLIQSDSLRAIGSFGAKIALEHPDNDTGNDSDNPAENNESRPGEEYHSYLISRNASTCEGCIHCSNCSNDTCSDCDDCAICYGRAKAEDLYGMFNLSGNLVDLTEMTDYFTCGNCTNCSANYSISCDCARCRHSYNVTEKGVSGDNNDTNTSGQYKGNNAKARIMEAVILTLVRLDYRQKSGKAVENVLDHLIASQGYSYCFTAKTCCSLNKITVGECDKIPQNAIAASKTIKTSSDPEKRGEINLKMWREGE
jgi:hypothetical protein